MAKPKREGKKKNITLIKKSNDLIEARYMFDIWETRFFLSILSQIHREDKEFEIYRVRYKDVIKTFGLRSNSSYDYLRQAAKNLMDRKVAVGYEVDGVQRETLYHIIRKVDYLKEGESGKQVENHEYIDVTIEQEMKPLLLQLQKNFTAYELQNVVKLGVYPIRIYELLKQYETIGRRKIKIDQMKKMFELTSEYPRFSNFFQKIVKPAIDEINDFTDLKIVDVIKHKLDRNVNALEFIFVRKSEQEIEIAHSIESKKAQIRLFKDAEIPDYEDLQEAEVIENEEISEKDRLFMAYQQTVVSNFGVTPTIFLSVLEGKTEAQLQQAIRVTMQGMKDGTVKNTAGFFIEALRQNFTNPKEEKNKKRQEEKNRVEVIQKELDQLNADRDKFVNDKIRELTALQSELTQEMIIKIEANPYLKIFLEGKKTKLGRKLQVEDYRKDFELRTLVKQGFIDAFPHEFDQVLGIFDRKIKQLSDSL